MGHKEGKLQMAAFSRKGKRNLKAIHRSSRPQPGFQYVRQALTEALGLESLKAFGVQFRLSCGGGIASLVSLEGRTLSQRRQFSAVKSHGVCHARSWTHLGPITPFFSPVSPFQNRNLCPMPVSSLCLEAYHFCLIFHRLTAREEFCLQMNPTFSLFHI